MLNSDENMKSDIMSSGSVDIEPKLPSAFLARMKEQLGAEYDAFLESYKSERTYGLRYNPLKWDKKRFLEKMPFVLREVPWAEEGFYYEAAQQPGKSIFHEAGAFYIQDPSAMAVVTVLEPKPGERILDLCAAPGGKSTQIAGRLQGEGLLVSNEIVPSRAKVLSRNIERMGIANCVVCREEPEKLAEFFPSFFDRVLVDAPCSGEGMFRKDDVAIDEWSPENVTMCAARQRDILEQAAQMVCAGGVLVYSTCTFSIEENENVIDGFVRMHPEFDIEDVRDIPDMTEAVSGGMPTLDKSARLWPHRIEGEGHFVARLRKAGEREQESRASRTIAEELTAGRKNNKQRIHKERKENNKGKERNKAKESERTSRELCEIFLFDELGLSEGGAEKLFRERALFNFGESLYLVPKQMIPLQGLQIERPGLQLGFCEKDRFKPSHALALYLHPEEVHNHYEMTLEQAERYVRGETFTVEVERKGWYLLSVQGCSIGFGKAAGGQMKNHYPKGLRR